MKLKNFFKKMALTLLDHKPTAAPEMPIGGASAKHSRAIQTAERKSKFTEILAKLEAQHKKRVAVRNEKSVHRMERIYRRTRFDSMLPENASDQGEHIPVVFICDDHYAFPTGVAILSLYVIKARARVMRFLFWEECYRKKTDSCWNHLVLSCMFCLVTT